MYASKLRCRRVARRGQRWLAALLPAGAMLLLALGGRSLGQWLHTAPMGMAPHLVPSAAGGVIVDAVFTLENSGPWLLAFYTEQSGYFLPGAEPELLGPDGLRVPGEDVTIGDGGYAMLARFDLTNAPVGWYDRRILNPDGSEQYDAGLVEIVQAGAPARDDPAPIAVLANIGTRAITIEGQHLNPFATVQLSRAGAGSIVGVVEPQAHTGVVYFEYITATVDVQNVGVGA